MTPTAFKGIRRIDTIAHYETLVSTGSVVINGVTVTYDPNYLYIVDESNYYTISQINSLLAEKQSTLTFDSAPTAGSTNPVTSEGIKTAIDNAHVEYADLAGNLSSDTYQPQESTFISQASANGIDILTGPESARLTKLKGFSLYYNQLSSVAANCPETLMTNAVTYSSQNHKIIFSGTMQNGAAGRTVMKTLFSATSASNPKTVKFFNGHKYAIIAKGNFANYILFPAFTLLQDQSGYLLDRLTSSRLFTFTEITGDYYLGFNLRVGFNYDGCEFYYTIFDFTSMFGAGKEPTIEEFKELFPLDWYDFNEGELISAQSSKITSYSANLYTENAFPVVAGKDYAVTGVTACNIVEKDSDGNTLKTTAYSSLSTVYALDSINHSGYVDSLIKGIRLTTSTSFVSLTDVIPISSDTVYFGLAWSKPYTDNKEHFAIEYALNNVILRSIGEYCDTYEPNGVITRKIGVLTAQTGAIGDTITLTGAISDSPIISSAGADIGTVSGTTLTLTKAISDATILFVLDTATTEQGTPYTEQQYVNDYGIQIFDTAFPQPCEFLYQINLKDYVQRLYGVSDGNPNNIAIKNQVLALTGQITVQTTDWNNNVATATFATLGTNDHIQFSPLTATDRTNYMNADIFATVSGTTVTFTATTTPSADITLTYVIIRGIN